MIKISEFRPGNFASDETGGLIIVDQENIDKSKIDPDSNKLSPVKIAESWLAYYDFDVKVEADSKFYSIKNFNKNNIFKEMPDLVLQWPLNNQFPNYEDLEIMYVHELQNLYQSLTHKDLPISPGTAKVGIPKS